MQFQKLRSLRVLCFLALSLLLVLACDGQQEGEEITQQQDREESVPEEAEVIDDQELDQVWIDRAGLEYVRIPPGSFQMGCVPGDGECDVDESPRHRVTISRVFWVSRTAVTVRAYMQFCEETGCSMPPEIEILNNRNLNPGWSYLDHPIVNVNWRDAEAYCEWAGVRLPTEAEWEYAARGGQEGWKYVWGNQELPMVDGIRQANVADEAFRREYRRLYEVLQRSIPGYDIFEGYHDGYGDVAPVGSFAANGFGLYDMAGNVFEWCADWYEEDYYSRSPTRDPQGPSSGVRRVLRGGAWDCNPMHIRLSNRYWVTPAAWCNLRGFRCVRDLDSP